MGCGCDTATEEEDERRMNGLETREASWRESMTGAVVDVGDEKTGEESCEDEADVLGSLSTLMAGANGRRASTSLPVSAYVCVQSATCHATE